ncbi:phage tail tip fiber protein [Enterobacter hormaechei]|uniref:phage tail tip fiber protein n=1 Tax=Enterobacter hormaechei TaxID=158836 RepID=UPI002FEF9C6A
MSQTYQICEVTVTLPSLGTITTDGSGNQIKHGDKCRVHLYAVKPDRHPGTIFDGFNVGAITFTGYTDSPFKRSQKIMVPDGYKLVALRVDDDGVPASWDSLPVHFTGGFIESPVDELDGIADALDTAQARHYKQFGNAEPGKTSVVFLADRWVAIEGKYSPDEMRDAVEYIKHRRLTKEFGKGLADLSPFAMKDGQVFIKDAVIGNGIVSANYSVTLNVAGKGKPHAAGMVVGVEGDQSKVVFEADRFKVNEAAQSASNNEETAFNGGLAFGGFPGAISHDGANPADGNNATAEPISSIASATGTATKTRLTDEMQELVLKAVRESDLFAALQAKIDAQTASVVGLQQAMHEAVKDALRNALKPGGILWAAISHR